MATEYRLAYTGGEINRKLKQIDDLLQNQSELANEINLNSNRLNALAQLEQGSTTGDAELIDIRLGNDGIVYNNAGSAIRTQFENTSTKINSLFDDISTYLSCRKALNLVKGYHDEDGNAVLDTNGKSFITTVFFDLTKVRDVYCEMNYIFRPYYYDSDFNFLLRGSDNNPNDNRVLLAPNPDVRYVKFTIFRADQQYATEEEIYNNFRVYEKPFYKFDFSWVNKGFVEHDTGDFIPYSGYVATDFIPLPQSYSIPYVFARKMRATGYAAGLAFYDENFNYLASTRVIYNDYEDAFEFPANAYYIRFSVIETYKDTAEAFIVLNLKNELDNHISLYSKLANILIEENAPWED